jgi:TATA-binding protein-associated factor
VASTVVNQQNSSLQSMETDQILDLFNFSSSADGGGAGGASGGAGAVGGNGDDANEDEMIDIDGEVKERGKKGFMDGLEELWGEEQYKEEYDLDGFLRGMKR